jgi:hypothetical protein
MCSSMSTDQLCVVFGNVRESLTRWEKIIPVNKKWREKMRPDFSKCDFSYVVWSQRASWRKSELWSLININNRADISLRPSQQLLSTANVWLQTAINISYTNFHYIQQFGRKSCKIAIESELQNFSPETSPSFHAAPGDHMVHGQFHFQSRLKNLRLDCYCNYKIKNYRYTGFPLEFRINL